MKTAFILFSDEVALASQLLAQADGGPDAGSAELWVLGGLNGAPRSEISRFARVTEIFLSDASHLREAACCADAAQQYFEHNPAELIVIPSGVRGDELAARLGVLTGAACLLAARALSFEGDAVRVKKPVYAGNLTAEFEFSAKPLVISLALGAELPPPRAAERQEFLSFYAETEAPPWLAGAEYEKIESAAPLKSRGYVLAAGRGVGKKENFEKLEELAEILGGELGGTRPAVYDGRLAPERMIGSSGAVLAPKCCLVFGASGAAPFMAGVEKSSLLVAVNRDPNALIFDGCDVGVVADCSEFTEALRAELTKK